MDGSMDCWIIDRDVLISDNGVITDSIIGLMYFCTGSGLMGQLPWDHDKEVRTVKRTCVTGLNIHL